MKDFNRSVTFFSKALFILTIIGGLGDSYNYYLNDVLILLNINLTLLSILTILLFLLVSNKITVSRATFLLIFITTFNIFFTNIYLKSIAFPVWELNFFRDTSVFLIYIFAVTLILSLKYILLFNAIVVVYYIAIYLDNSSAYFQENIPIVVLVLCCFSIIVYWFSKLMKETLSENLRLQNEVFQEKELGLQNSLAFRNRELTFQAVMIANSSEAIENTKRSLRSITNSKTQENSKTLIDKLIHDLGIYENSEIWNNFQDRFVKVHPDFIDQLASRFPSLSPAEQKLASFLKLGLSSKEVALLTSNEKNSVDVARSRLRKKLGLTRSDNLNEFLNQL